MAWSLTNGVLVQTGTDTSLSGLDGLVPVTVTDHGFHKVYDVGATPIRVEGSLTIASSAREQLIFGGDVGHDVVDLEIAPGATLTAGAKRADPLLYDYQWNIPAFSEKVGPTGYGDTNGQSGEGQGSSGRRSSIWVRGTFNMYGRRANARSVNNSVDGVIRLEYSAIRGIQASYLHGHRVTLFNSLFNGFNFVAGQAYEQLLGWSVEDALVTISNSSPDGGVFSVTNVPRLPGADLMKNGRSSGTAPRVNFFNLASGSDYQVSSNGRQWDAYLYRRIGTNVVDLAGAPLPDTKVFTVGSPGTGAVRQPDPSGRLEYDFNFAYFSSRGGVRAPVFYTKNQDASADLIDVFYYAYGYTVAALTNVSLRGVDRLEQLVQLLPDFSITEPDRSVALGYAELETARKWYDRTAAETYVAYAGQRNLPIARSGAEIDARALNVVVDPTAAGAYDLTGNTLTIKAGVFTGDITTTGTVTEINGAVVQGVVTDANGTRFPATSLEITGFEPGSDIVVLPAGSGERTPLAIYDDVQSSSVLFTVTAPGDLVDIAVYKVGFVPTTVKNFPQPSVNGAVRVTQQADRAYQN